MPKDQATTTADETLIADLMSAPTDVLMQEATRLRDNAHGSVISYSRKVFVPLTKLCRDVCHYCTFAQTPKSVSAPFMSVSEVLDIVRDGEEAGCTEVLLTLGDKPELRYAAAREALRDLGFDTTIDYLIHICGEILSHSSLVPHVNPGLLSDDDLARLRKVSASAGIMLESTSERLMMKGSCHYGSPDKDPNLRMETLRAAGRQKVPFTTGILIGIGETRRERMESLLAIRDLHKEFGHIQEVIVQNFRAKPGTLMANAPEPGFEELQRTVAAARIILGGRMNIQVPPNLSSEKYQDLIDAGINDWGGVSPVTPDHVNPEAAWPQLNALEARTSSKGKTLLPRLPSYPAYVREVDHWHSSRVATALRVKADAQGYARTDNWAPGTGRDLPLASGQLATPRVSAHNPISRVLSKATNGDALSEIDISTLFSARGADVNIVTQAADVLRRERTGDIVTYVVNRNINYTNVCRFSCSFCAFSKGQKSDKLRGRAYDVPIEEVVRRAVEAWDRGATEVCLQGGIHPDYSGDTYLEVVRAIKAAVPEIHIHAFSPLEVNEGAQEAGLPVPDYLRLLKDAGLGTLPGTAAEVLDDEVRKLICPDKLNTERWLSTIRDAHQVGLRTTATIMFGHVDSPKNWARHLVRIRELQLDTGGFTEFVPLPFIHTEAPMFLKGMARPGPTYREALLMHAVARLALYRVIDNIQVSWVKMGEEGVKQALRAGANDLGGTLMNESISNAAGTVHGQEWSPARMERVIRSIERTPQQRSTGYQQPSQQTDHSLFEKRRLAEVSRPNAGKFAAIGSRRKKHCTVEEQVHAAG